MTDLVIAPVGADRPPLSEQPELRARLGVLLAQAVPQFYGLLPIDGDLLHQALGDAIGTSGSEFENAFVAGPAEAPLGIVASVPAQALARAQQASTIMLMRHVDRSRMAEFRSVVADYSKTVEPIDAAGQYLSRIAVAPEARGQGVGKRLVETIVALAGGGDVWLHVAADNAAAIRLYEALGFRFASDEQFGSRAMRRPGGLIPR